jgi:cysteine desulfurase
VNRRIYADHAATTPVRPEAVAAMLPLLEGLNPSSLHAEGRRARAALDEARATVAASVGASPREIVFTGSGSEADNLAILGAARAYGRPAHAITSPVEHHAVLHAFEVLAEEGWEVTFLPPDSGGRVDPDSLQRALRPQTALVSLMLANNELGTLNPVAQLAALARRRGVLFHTDAIAALGRVPFDVESLGVDLLSLSAHKCYGPKGVGTLYVRAGTPLAAQIVGGAQETGLRAGTENVAGIAGFARALVLAAEECQAEARRLCALRERFEAGLRAAIENVRLNAAGFERLPNLSSVAFAGIDATEAVIRLDLEGVAVSAGSACASGSGQSSHVLAALNIPAWAKLGTVRFSFGKLTVQEDVEALVRMLPDVIAALRGEVRPNGY